MASFTRQSARDADTGARLANSPRELAKLNVSIPLMGGDRLRTGIEVQHVGRRYTLGSTTPGYTVANLTVFSAGLAPGLEMSATVYNLSDRRYSDPGSAEHLQDRLIQDGRAWRIKLVYSL